MARFKVRWTMDFEGDYRTPEEAAKKALETQRDPESIATFLQVFDEGGKVTEVDLGLDDPVNTAPGPGHLPHPWSTRSSRQASGVGDPKWPPSIGS